LWHIDRISFEARWYQMAPLLSACNVNVTHVAYLHFQPGKIASKSLPQSSWLFSVGCFAA